MVKRSSSRLPSPASDGFARGYIHACGSRCRSGLAVHRAFRLVLGERALPWRVGTKGMSPGRSLFASSILKYSVHSSRKSLLNLSQPELIPRKYEIINSFAGFRKIYT
jgi:hypothetical protein